LGPHFVGARRTGEISPGHGLGEIQNLRDILAEEFIDGLEFRRRQTSERLASLLRQGDELADDMMGFAKGHSLFHEIISQIRRQQ
jgi:hypothetical protein